MCEFLCHFYSHTEACNRVAKVFKIWNNFKAAAEKGGMQHPDHPLYFFMADTAVSGLYLCKLFKLYKF